MHKSPVEALEPPSRKALEEDDIGPSSSNQNTAITVEALRFQYGSRVALEDVTLGVQTASIFGLLGPNGGGKTTLFRILCTLMAPDRGRARILGYDVQEEAARVRTQIGVVFQSNSLDVQLTVEENLRHQGHLHGFLGQRLNQRITELLDLLGLVNRRRERVGRLSGGLQRRVEIAKGLIHSPRVLLLDEPSSGLDPAVRLDVWNLLKLLVENSGLTVFLTTHLMEEADRCDDLAILNRGQVVASGSPKQLKESIAGEIVTVVSKEAPALQIAIRERFGYQMGLVDGNLRLACQQGHKFLGELLESFGQQIEATTVGQPTLEDVFIEKTGHHFWGEEQLQTPSSQ